MKKISKMTIVSIISYLFIIYLPATTFAGVDLPWETTFGCDEWEMVADGYDPGCGGIALGGTGTIGGVGSSIISSANMAAGAGGRGWRQLIGDGTNVQTAPFYVTFSGQSEIWIRWYLRYQPGFTWGGTTAPNPHYHKLLYIDVRTGQYIIPEPTGNGFRIAYYNGSSSGAVNSAANEGWPVIGDGNWHCFEVHVTTAGTYQMWIDEKLIIDEEKVITMPNNFVSAEFGTNQNEPDNDSAYYVDWDDIAISNTGYIGPVGGSDKLPEPTTVSIDSQTSGQTVSGNISVSAAVSGDVTGVQFKLDGANLAPEDTSSPYSVSWDSSINSDGVHSLSAVARDSEGTLTTSDSVNVIVNNSSKAPAPVVNEVLFNERFEDANFSSRGWYDNTNLSISTTEHIAGSSGSAEFRFAQGGTAPVSGGAVRRKFTETDSIYVSYYVKYSSNWEGSNRTYHPHEFQILTNLDTDWTGPAYTYLTAYIEQNEGVPLLAIQDGKNIDESKIGLDLTGVTEQRAVAGCNGDSDGYGDGDCYSMGATHWNGKNWKAAQVYFQDSPGKYYKNDWHHVEAYFKLNSISDGIGMADGVIKYWYDGQIVIDHNNIMLRTGENPDMQFNQFIIGPWIGDGSPVDQTFWIDNLSVATDRPLPPPFDLDI